jgi:hypothetical protein
MRFMAGGSLAQRIARGPLALEEAYGVLTRVASALDHAHSRGVIHRDLKPGNVLFDTAGQAYLSDFGIAQLSEATISLTVSGVVIGTPAYMSPEQVQGDVELDARSDIYSLGIILFEMLTGQQPYRANTPTKVMMKHVLEPVPHMRDLEPALPSAADEIVARAMSKERNSRFATSGELAAALLCLLDGQPPHVSVSPVRRPPPVRARQSTTLKFASSLERAQLFGRLPRWVAGSILGLVGLAGLIGGGLFAARGINHPATTASAAHAGIITVTSEPSPTTWPSPTPSPTRTARPATATPAPVLLSIQTDAICRLGPGVDYDVAAYLTTGQTELAQGRNPEGTWWWINLPAGERGCWVSGLLVGLSGDAGALPVFTPGPTSTIRPTPTPVPGEPTSRPAEATAAPTEANTQPPPGPQMTPSMPPTPRLPATRRPTPRPATATSVPATATSAATEEITLPPHGPDKTPFIPIP